MKIFSTLCIVSLLFLSFSPTKQDTKKIESAQVSFEFVSKKVKGSLEGFKSQSSIDLENLENSYFKGSVDAKTIDTNNGLRNWSLRSGKYFDVDNYPRLTFESSRVTMENGQLKVKGTLRIKGIEKEVVMSFKRNGQQLVGTTSVNAMDYGIKIKKKREENLVKVKMVFDISS